MEYVFLSGKFYNQYDSVNYPEIERKAIRPYIMLKVVINGIDFGLPLRSGISHKYAFWTDKSKKCGVDYSKAVVIQDSTYIDTGNKPRVRPDEHSVLLGKDYIIKTGFLRYIEIYKNALNNLQIDRNKTLCKCSTLQYFHNEIGITSIVVNENDVTSGKND